MKKSLIALAVLAASGAAFAQSSVTLYGLVDASLGSVRNTNAAGVATSSTQLISGAIDTNRYGFMGTEDLGGGLKANFKLENGFNLDNGTSGTAGQAFNRYAYVGLSGSFGEVRFGRNGTAYDEVNGAADAVFDSALSPVNSIFASTGYNWNPANGIIYFTPNLSGFSAAVSYALDEKATGGSNVTAANVAYAAGPLAVSLGYQTQKVYNGTTFGADTNFTRLNGAYDFGVAKLKASYGKVNYNTAGVGNVNEYQIGVDAPLSAAVTVSASYASSKQDAGATAEVNKSGLGIGATYSLSKRTYVYGGYETDKVKDTSVDHSLFAVGIHHVF